MTLNDSNGSWSTPYAKESNVQTLRIGGESVAGAADADILNPATGQLLGRGAIASPEQIQAALDATAAAQPGWAATPVQQRAAILQKAAAILREAVDDLALTMTLEQGKPLEQAHLEVLLSAETFDWYAAEALRISGRVMPARAPGGRQSTLPEPIGPVAALTPWNFPALLAARKIGPALAAGCATILKPAEETPASAVALCDALTLAGLPAGVLNVIYGEPAMISEALITSPVIRKISFTGSVPGGRHLAELAGRNLKRCTLELGGHAPVLVMDDCDPNAAAHISAIGKTRNAGQVCTSPTRFYVQEGVYDAFLESLKTEMAGMKVGDGRDGVDVGPMANGRRIDAIQALIADATARGARIATGGSRLGGEGFFFQPTVLTDVPDDADIMNTEPFGPIAIVTRVGSLADALERANRAPVGLAGYAFTNDHRRAVEIAERLQVGMVAINSFAVSHIEAPFGGIKDSGYGYEGGAEGLEAYLHHKYVHHA